MLRSLILPPGLFILLALLGGLAYRRVRGPAAALMIASAIASYLLSTPLTAALLSRVVEQHASVTRETIDAGRPGAIVLLGGGYREHAPEYGPGPTLHERTLARTRYAARLHRSTGLPIVASGGSWREMPSEAALMAKALVEDFGVSSDQILTESSSRNTWENAVRSTEVLRARGVSSILVVTTAAHLTRARHAFETQGVHVIPAPTLFSTHRMRPLEARSWLPSIGAINDIHYATYELLGRLWYLVRHPT